MTGKVDLHMHTTYSDGFYTPSQNEKSCWYIIANMKIPDIVQKFGGYIGGVTLFYRVTKKHAFH